MKKLLLMLLFTMTTFAQTASVKGVTLTYNNKTKTMLLNMLEKTFIVPENSDIDVQVKIVREFDLTMKIGDQEYSMTESYFETNGYKHPMFYVFWTLTPASTSCKSVKESNFVYKFSNVKPGEYIVVVTKRCDEKYVIEKSTTSLIVR